MAGGRRDPAPHRERRLTGGRRRLLALVVTFVLLAGALTARLVELQVGNPDPFVAWGEAQRITSVPLPGRRGELLDRNGEQLAISIPQTTLWADPRLVTDPVGAAEQLAPLLDLEPEVVQARLAANGAFSYLARKVDDETATAVVALGVDGVFTLEEQRRFNPSGDQLARSVLGTVGLDNEGLSGIELLYEDLLAGEEGVLHFERAPNGYTIASGSRDLTPAQQGVDLHLTIDRPLQFEVERSLTGWVEEMGARGGVVVAMRPGTGEVLAMATVGRDDDGRAVPSTENRAVTWAFEPGSIMKPLTFAAVLEDGIAEPGSVRAVPSTLQLYDDVFSDSSPHETLQWSVRDILVKSSNIGTVLWARDLGGERLYHYLRDFGFGSLTPLDFIGETPGIMLDLDDWSGTSIATIPTGQGISVTPLQMLTAMNTIANRGVYVPPKLVLDAVDADGESHPMAEAAIRRVVSEETAQSLVEIMTSVVIEGTGQNAQLPGYAVAGKTGTARKPLPTGGYQDAAGNYRYTASFIGFLPAESPEISFLVTIDEPSATIYGGYAAAPLFAELAQYAARRFQIPPVAELVTDAAPELVELPLDPVRGETAPPPEPTPTAEDTVPESEAAPADAQ